MAPPNFLMQSILQPMSKFRESAAGKRTEDVTDAPEGLAADELYSQLLEMYWLSVTREMKHILLTLRTWQRPPYESTILPDEENDFIHGYDTFMEQLSQSTHSLAQKHRKTVETQKKSKKEKLPSYHDALQDRLWDILAEDRNSECKLDMRLALESQPKFSICEQRARMLLQSAGFLDIDKVMEYRPPEKDVTFWKRPAAPQLQFLQYDEHSMPVFRPLSCTTCSKTVRGCTFRSGEITECEDCYRQHHYGRSDFMKSYKHSIISTAITPEISHSICHCSRIEKFSAGGNPLNLFPVDKTEQHRKKGPASFRCGLYKVPELIAEAKYREVLLKHETPVKLEELKNAGAQAKRRRREMLAFKKGLSLLEMDKLVDSKDSFAEFGQSGLRDKEDEVPFLMRPITNKYPFGNVHMALRVGPLLVENGVEHTKHGALITNRDPPFLQVMLSDSADVEDIFLVADDGDRRIWPQKRKRIPKRYKCMMKQVVGGAFSGTFDLQLEGEIVNALIIESQKTPDPGLRVSVRAKRLDASIDRLVKMLRQYIGSRVEIYLNSIASRLVDPETKLQWNNRTNNCQMFCDSILDYDLFGSLLAPPRKLGTDKKHNLIGPLYLISFVCRPGSYNKENVFSKYDVPNGLTEEYLLKFRYGRHEDSNIVDTLQEYWYDWGAFGGPLYSYQDLFPWDCTEAYNRYPTKCNDCNISKHVLAFPFDSWSLISLHLSKPRHLYPPPKSTSKTTSSIMTDADWFHNRLILLLAQNRLLRVAAAMSNTPSVRAATTWLSTQPVSKLDRLKLGGIHRAQPYSHHFESGAYHHYFTAQWAHLLPAQRIAEYEALRDGRARKDDVESEYSSSSDSGGGCADEMMTMLLLEGTDGGDYGSGGDGGGDGGD